MGLPGQRLVAQIHIIVGHTCKDPQVRPVPGTGFAIGHVAHRCGHQPPPIRGLASAHRSIASGRFVGVRIAVVCISNSYDPGDLS